MGQRAAAVTINVPFGALVVLVGVSGSGKSTFAARHFSPSAILSSDAMRTMVGDDPDDQTATDAAFELLHTALGLRLARGRTTLVDATNVEAWARARLLAVARRFARPALAIVLDVGLDVCLARNAGRTKPRPAAALRRQQHRLRQSLPTLADEGFAQVAVLESEEAAALARVRVDGRRQPAG